MRSLLLFYTCCFGLGIIAWCEAKSDHHLELLFNSAERKPSTSSSSHTKRTADNDQENRIPDEHQTKYTNETQEDDRITIGEPYKSIIQTTARFAIAQTHITKHVNIDTAMNLLNDAGYFLAKPVVLLKAVKMVVISLATFMFSLIFFPGANKFLETAWQNPMSALNLDSYLTNGLQERSVLAAIGSKTDETLSRVGLQDDSCRQRSICYMGEIVKCSFPYTAETVTKFATENFSSSSLKDNVYARAFISGFVDKNCTNIGTMNQQDTNNCLGNFFNSILSGTDQRHSARNGGGNNTRRKK